MQRKEYDVQVKLVGNQRPCHVGHKVGDEWLFQYKIPEGMCFLAYNSIFPFLTVLKYGGTFPWQEDPDVVMASCPDSEVVNVFELRRVPAKPW
jgi:uncharacterized repeat protein (TIGR04076 family)